MITIINKDAVMVDENYAKQLRTPGHRLTRQRMLVLEIVRESQEHLDADTIYQRAKARDPNIGIATIYRALARLKEAGLVQEQRLGENHGHFETTQSRPHYHFTCLKCGKIVEFESPQVMRAARQLCKNEGLQITQIQIHLSGYCSQCREDDGSCE
jgi:Fur family ferric uptake transcriptional regulator